LEKIKKKKPEAVFTSTTFLGEGIQVPDFIPVGYSHPAHYNFCLFPSSAP
jgi:hypothetical protein